MNQLDIHNELYTLILQSNIATELDLRLKTLSNVDEILMYLHHKDEQCLSLLMLAALNGKDDMIRVLLSYSSDINKLVELRGNVLRTNHTLVRNATALWCACDRGHYTAARTLIETGGAKIHHGPRYPLLIDAVISGRLDTVQFLIENQYTDVNSPRSNENYKLNSLIMAVIYGHIQIVAYLLEKGSKYDYTTPTSCNTSLGYAAIKGHLDIVRLLCSVGACTTLKNKSGQTPLMLAAKYDRMSIVDYLLEQVDIEIGIKQLELVACSFVIPTSSNMIISRLQYHKMFHLMYKIFEIRKIKNLSKLILPPIAAYNFQKECETIEEFYQIQSNHDCLYTEALIIRERILFPEKDQTLCKPLLIRGDKLIEKGQFELCLHLWVHTFYLYQNMNLETGLHRFVWLFCKMIQANIPISPQRFVQIARLTFEPSQQQAKDDCIKNALCFLAIAVKILEQSTLNIIEYQLIYQWITDLCRQKRLTSSGQTLLHLAVDIQTYYDINYRSNDIKPILMFPNIAITQLLLTHCNRWIDVNAVETLYGNTALHIICQNDTHDSLAIIKLLINSGAHIDSLNMCNHTPFDVAQTNDIKNFLKTKQFPSRLKCLCARFIISKELPYERLWPKETDMNKFLFLHGALTKQSRNIVIDDWLC